MLGKIYCKNCENIFRHLGWGFYECWVYPDLRIDTLRQSATGNWCSHYKRKWWKFWIKEG